MSKILYMPGPGRGIGTDAAPSPVSVGAHRPAVEEDEPMSTDTPYLADEARYGTMTYRRTGRSGLDLPALSLGLWHNFGGTTPLQNQRDVVRRAFDLGITHFDLANNYGPPAGSAEENFGRLLATDLRPYRDELVVS